MLSLLALGTALHAAPRDPDWHIVQTRYSTADTVVAGFNVLDFGARGDGRSDCTEVFQEALDRMKEAGGGTVFVPAGRYAFQGSLTIPVSVTLRGEWLAPTRDDAAVVGTILMPSGGRGDPDGKPFITVDYCAGIKDLNIWYPGQSATKPEPYPFCLVQKGGDNATFENLTLVNPYQGIRIGPGGNELHLVRNVYGTPLKTGIQYDSTTDIGRLDKIRFSPHWWCRSGLPGAPRRVEWIKAHGTAIHMLRSDWEYVADVAIDGYRRGYLVSEGVRGAANAQFYRLIIRNCTTAMEVEKTNPFGMAFTECHFDGIEHGVLVAETFDSAILFSNCIFEGREALRVNGDGNILLEHCRIARGNVVLEKGAHSILGSKLRDWNTWIQVGEEVTGVALADNAYHSPSPAVRSKAREGVVQHSSEPLPLNRIPAFPDHTERRLPQVSGPLEVVTPSGSDDTPAIQRALDGLSAKGRGIVFLPGGDYRIEGRLNVPSGVELRGIHDVPHHTMGGGSVLHLYPSGDEPTVTLQSNSSLRGLGFNYPEQRSDAVIPYPFLIQGRGDHIRVINVNAANPFKFMDFMTHRCDHHYIDYPSGAPLMTGIAVGGGSRDGYVGNMQFNPHYAMRTPAGNKRFAMGDAFRSLWTFQKENLDALVVGDCEGEFLYQNFVYGSLYGIHFTRQSGNGAVQCVSHGHGTDGSKVGCYFEYGHGTISMINTELVAMSSQNKTAIKVSEGFDSEATLINTLVWGSPDVLAEIGNGTLSLQNLHVHHHGKGLRLSRGALHAFNLSFNQPGSHLWTAPGTDARLTGFITRGPFQSSGEPARPMHVIER